MRNEAAGCGFRGYAALPLFDSHTNGYYGVLEFLLAESSESAIRLLSRALQIPGFKSLHTARSTSGHMIEMEPEESEISELIELAVATVPGLYLAQVWAPCQQCPALNPNLCCMELTSFITSEDNIVNFCHHNDDDDDDEMNVYLDACEFHNLQLGLDSLNSSNIWDLSISRNPLAHYAQRARISHSFAVSLESLNNSNYFHIIQFFLQASSGSFLHLFLSVMQMNLRSLKFREVFQKPNVVECELFDSLDVISSYKEEFSEYDFITYLGTIDSCCLRPSFSESGEGWVFCPGAGERLPVKEKIEKFMKKIAVSCNRDTEYWIVQFWAPKMVGGRCCLQTSDQSYAIGPLAQGLASYRKKCMAHYYYVDHQAKEEELGPPSRVFRNGHPEISPDLYYYTKEEFPMRNHAVHCCSRGYFALPIFDAEHNHNRLGVLEFLGFDYHQLEDIEGHLEAVELRSSPIDFHPRFLACEQPPNTIDWRREALTEVKNALQLINGNIPQLHMAYVWVPNGKCVNSHMSCMELAVSTNCLWESMPTDSVHWIHVQAGKGMIGMVLASENSSCFCRNLSEFSRADQPLSHVQMFERREVCLAICLRSSHTGGLLYVVEFFLYAGPPTYEYVRSFLNFLLPILKHELKSFKMACGKQLGEELVVEVIEFSETTKLVGSSELEHTGEFPIKFESVQYAQKHTQEQHQEVATSDSKRRNKGKMIIEEHNVAALDSKGKAKGKRRAGFHPSLEFLQPYFVKKLDDVAEELGVGKSAIKRACREHGIDRWPYKQEFKKNSSLIERGSGRESQKEKSADHVIVEKAAEKVMIKVQYEEDIIKFEFCLSLGTSKLFEKVATRLNLKVGTFKLKYMDQDNDEILLANDEDLELCCQSQMKGDKTFIKLLVRL